MIPVLQFDAVLEDQLPRILSRKQARTIRIPVDRFLTEPAPAPQGFDEIVEHGPDLQRHLAALGFRPDQQGARDRLGVRVPTFLNELLYRFERLDGGLRDKAPRGGEENGPHEQRPAEKAGPSSHGNDFRLVFVDFVSNPEKNCKSLGTATGLNGNT